MTQAKDVLSIDDAARFLGVPRRTLEQWYRKGFVAGRETRMGQHRKVSFDRAALLDAVRPRPDAAKAFLDLAGVARVYGTCAWSIDYLLAEGVIPVRLLPAGTLRVRQDGIERLTVDWFGACRCCDASAQYDGAHTKREHGTPLSGCQGTSGSRGMLLADLALSCRSNASIGVVEMGLSAQEADLIAAARGLHSEDRARLIRAARAIGAKRATSAEDLTDVGLRAL